MKIVSSIIMKSLGVQEWDENVELKKKGRWGGTVGGRSRGT